MPPRSRKATDTATTDTDDTSGTPAPVVVAATDTRNRSNTASLLTRLATVEIEPDTSDKPFATGKRSTIPKDHPMVVVFMDTYKHQKPAKFKSVEPDEEINLLRRIAAEQGLGVRTSVTTLEGEKITLPRRAKGEKSPKYSDQTKGAEVFVKFMGRDRKQYAKKDGDVAATGDTQNAE